MTKGPDAFRTISEVAAQLETPAHVLRFWETKFPQVRPVKGAGGRRYFRPDDVALLGGIKVLLHEQGMTIRGVQKLLKERGARNVATLSSLPWDGAEPAPALVEAPAVEEAPPATEEVPTPVEVPAEEFADAEEASAEVLRGPWPETDEAAGDLSLERLRRAVKAADRDRLAALSGRIAPLVDRLRGLREGPLRRAG